MAKHEYRLLEAGAASGYHEPLEEGAEFEHDYGESEQAVLAAGWVERADNDKKGGKK